MVAAALQGIGVALPLEAKQERLWEEFFADHFHHDRRAAYLFHNTGVEIRHSVAIPYEDDVRYLGTGARMQRFLEAALPLGEEAVRACLVDAGVKPEDVGLLTVACCTGYATPGLDILLAHRLGLPDWTQRLHVGHMGCYAAVPALAAVADAAAARSKVGVLLCLELTTLHIQPPTDEVDIGQVVSHALFSDAAAAVAVAPDAPGLEVVDVMSRTDHSTAHLMSWEVTDRGFRMGLSPRVPAVLRTHVADLVGGLLARHGLAAADVAAWAVHPGGLRILDVVEEQLGLDCHQLGASREVLRAHGNCSSATLILVLDELRARGEINGGDYVVCLAFGPGLTLYAALLRQRP